MTYNREKNTEIELRSFVLENDHPCLMAQAVVQNDNFIIKDYGNLGNASHAPQLLENLKEYLSSYSFETNDFFTFIATYQKEDMNELEFENKLWQELQNLHELDDVGWDPEVSSNPESHNFSFSIAGKAFYIVGLHPRSSRLARRFPRPAVVFNLHWQFEQLREMEAYEDTRDKIRARDKALQGNVNPMLADFGKNREATQYSGRLVDQSWKCPFHPKEK